MRHACCETKTIESASEKMVRIPNVIISSVFLQTKFGARCRAWNVAQYNQDSSPSIRLRLDDELDVPASIMKDFSIKDTKEVLR